jgi:hypothetical protein
MQVSCRTLLDLTPLFSRSAIRGWHCLCVCVHAKRGAQCRLEDLPLIFINFILKVGLELGVD